MKGPAPYILPRDALVAWLASALKDGRVATNDLIALALAAGHNRTTLHRAKVWLGIEAVKVGWGSEGKWYWQLPDRSVDV